MSADCPVEEGECLAWAHKYLRDCVCNFRDEISLLLGLMSVFSWGVAEVPQIITNFNEKTTEGVSLAFLMTWVLGDVFNLAGCWLEPATLPTQFYMALLYTITTLILVIQTIYYGYLICYFYPPKELIDEPVEEESQKALKLDVEGQTRPRPVKSSGRTSPELSSSVISVPRSSRDLFYTSARSLASSHTPTVGSYLVGSRESGSNTNQSFLRTAATSDSVPATSQEYLIPSHGSPPDSSASSARGGTGLGRTAQAAAGSILLVGTVALSCNYISGGSSGFTVDQAGRRALLRTGRSLLLHSRGPSAGGANFIVPNYFREEQAVGPWGEVFGWCMAAIYMGGRLPQILLNIKRGTVEGLNPLMFIFALVGNATYVGSILARTLEWKLIKPNMPWLVDAGVCVCLDIFIICQFAYYASRSVKREEDPENTKGSYQQLVS